MLEFWTAVISSLTGSLLGSGISVAAMRRQTRSTNAAAFRQVQVLTSAEDKRFELAEARAAARTYHNVIGDVIDALRVMHEATCRGRSDTRIAAFQTASSAAERTIGRFICRLSLILPMLPTPQRDWLETITDDAPTFFFIPLDALNDAKLANLGRELREYIDWLYWAQEVLVTVIKGTSEYPSGLAQEQVSAIA